MEKLTDIVVLYHKAVEYGLPDNEIFTPIEVGADYREPVYDFGLRDNEGDSISHLNPLFAETTGIYWNWKHLRGKKYAGNFQYRRRLAIESYEQLEEVFKEHKVLVAAPIMVDPSVKGQYSRCHNGTDLDIIKEIVLDLYPEYKKSWEDYIENGRILFYSNGFIMKEEDYARYCEWLFSILFKFSNGLGFNNAEELYLFISKQIAQGKRPNFDSNGGKANSVRYQSQLCGFLSERLLTLYLLHNYKWEEIAVFQYTKMENCL